MPTQSTAPSYRILTHSQRPRRTWRTITLTPTHRISFDPSVYAGVLYPPHPAMKDHPDAFHVVTTQVGEIGLGRVA